MEIYRSPMEKILQEGENNTVITNPKEPAMTLFRKIAYRYAYWKDKFSGMIGSHPDRDKQA